MTLNHKSEDGIGSKRLIKTADVVIENFRPDVKDRLGLDYESLKRVSGNHLGSISGFGQMVRTQTARFDQILWVWVA